MVKRKSKSKNKKCSRTKYKALFRKYIKTMAFKSAVRKAWAGACRK